MRLSFHGLAERELNDAARYYEQESPGLGRAFITEVEHTCNAIHQFPEAAPVVIAKVRRRIMRRFPYALLYSVHGDDVRILAVMNLRRRPGYWIGRS